MIRGMFLIGLLLGLVYFCQLALVFANLIINDDYVIPHDKKITKASFMLRLIPLWFIVIFIKTVIERFKKLD